MILLIYDISDNSVRTRISDICKDHGLSRLQKSAFLGEVEPETVEHISADIDDVMDNDLKEGSDSAIILPLCNTCIKKRLSIGKELNIDNYRDVGYAIVE